MSKTYRHLLHQKVSQRISVMKTNSGVFGVFKTTPNQDANSLENIEFVCFH